jgi:glycosyltransferase involved in cell wall biosynthesis
MYKICFIANPAWPHVEKWARYLIAQPGYEVHVISSREPDFAGAVWHELNTKSQRFLPWTLATKLAYWMIFRRVRPDVVHVHNIESSFFPAVMVWQGPLVLTAYGLDVTLGGMAPEPPAVRRQKVRMIQRADAVTAASRFLLDTALAYGQASTEKGTVTPFGIDLDQFMPQKRDDRNRHVTLGFFKDLKPEYGPLEFLNALRIIRSRCGDVRAIMVGDGPLLEDLSREIAKLDMTNVVELHRKLPHERMPEMFRRIDVCVMPSRHESFGVVALESQAMEVPVVATRVEGLPEVVRDGTTGLLLDSNDPESVAEAVIRLLCDDGMRRSMGKTGRAFVADKFSLQSNGRVMEEVYRRVMHA